MSDNMTRVLTAFERAQNATDYYAAKELAGSILARHEQLTAGIDAAIACRTRLMAKGVL